MIDVRVKKAAESKAAALLEVEIQNCEKMQKIEQQRAKIQRDRIDYLTKFLFWAGVQFASTTPALLMLLVWGCICLLIGLNGLPSKVTCSAANSLCYYLRLNKTDTEVAHPPMVDKPILLHKKKPNR